MADTIRVKRANVVLDISSNDKDLYLNKGYSVVDEAGNVLEAAIANDVDALKRQVKDLQDELVRKNEEIAKLKASKAKTEKVAKS